MPRHIDLKPIEDEAPGIVAEVVDEGKDGSPWLPSRARCGGMWLHWTGWKENAGVVWYCGQWFTILNGSMYYASHPGRVAKVSTGTVLNLLGDEGQELVYQYSEEILVKGLREATLVRLVNLLAGEGVIGGVKQEERQNRTEAAYHLQRQQAMQRMMELGRRLPVHPVYPGSNLRPLSPDWTGMDPATAHDSFTAYNGISRVDPELAQARTTEEVLAYWRPRLDQESMAMVSGLVARARSRAAESSWMSITELELLSHLSSGEVTSRLAILFRPPVSLVEMHPSGLLFRARRYTLFLDRPRPDTYQWQAQYYNSRTGVATPMIVPRTGEGAEQQAITSAQEEYMAEDEQASGEIDMESSSG